MAKLIIAEMRPRLQACSIFFLCEKDMLNSKTIKIIIKSSSIEIVWMCENVQSIQKITLPDYKLVSKSMTCLRIDGSFLSFRLQTEPPTISGSFSAQVVQPLQSNHKPNNISTDLLSLKPPFSITCHTCGQVLSSFVLKRALPLPSGTTNAADWFCHAGSNVLDISPRNGDLLYGLCHIELHSEALNSSKLRREKKVLRCGHCYAWLGTRVASRVTLWNSTVGFGKPSKPVTPLEDFVRIVTETALGSTIFTSRFILETYVAADTRHYLLIWIIDKNLQLLTNVENLFIGTELKHNMETVLKLRNAVKFLYLYQSTCTSVVNSWQGDLNVQSIPIAKPMFAEGLTYLQNVTQCIPLSYRVSNGFFTAYMQL